MSEVTDLSNLETRTQLRKSILSIKSWQELSDLYLEGDLIALLENIVSMCFEYENQSEVLTDYLDIGFKILRTSQVEQVRHLAMDIVTLVQASSCFDTDERLRNRVWKCLIHVSHMRQDKRMKLVVKAYDILEGLLDSEHASIRDKTTVFYCDQKTNPTHHIFIKAKEGYNVEFFDTMERNLKSLLIREYAEYTCAISDYGTLSTEVLRQGYFDLYIYGECGLGKKDISKDRRKLLLDALSLFAEKSQISEPVDKDNQHKQKYFDHLQGGASKALIKSASQFENDVKQHLQNPNFTYEKEELMDIGSDIDDFLERVNPLSEEKFGKTLTKLIANLNTLKKSVTK